MCQRGKLGGGEKGEVEGEMKARDRERERTMPDMVNAVAGVVGRRSRGGGGEAKVGERARRFWVRS